jgi:hypothetical protein
MAKLRNGINGPFSGKVGTVVGATWKGVAYMRSLPIRTSKPTPGEKANRTKFKMAQQWLKPLLPFVRVGWKGYTPTVEGFIAAKSYLMKNAMEGTGKDSKVIPSKMLVSYGDLPLSDNIKVQVLPEKKLQFSWDPKIPDDIRKAHAKDQVMMIVYDVQKGYARMDIAGQLRYMGSDTLQLFTGRPRTYHVYVAFVAQDRSRQSMSVYLGEVTV